MEGDNFHKISKPYFLRKLLKKLSPVCRLLNFPENGERVNIEAVYLFFCCFFCLFFFHSDAPQLKVPYDVHELVRSGQDNCCLYTNAISSKHFVGE